MLAISEPVMLGWAILAWVGVMAVVVKWYHLERKRVREEMPIKSAEQKFFEFVAGIVGLYFIACFVWVLVA